MQVSQWRDESTFQNVCWMYLNAEGEVEYEIYWKIPEVRIIFESQTIIENLFQIILSFFLKTEPKGLQITKANLNFW